MYLNDIYNIHPDTRIKITQYLKQWYPTEHPYQIYVSQSITHKQQPKPKWVTQLVNSPKYGNYYCYDTTATQEMDKISIVYQKCNLEVSFNDFIITLDTLLISLCKVVVVDGSEPSWGVTGECILAKLMGIPVVIVVPKDMFCNNSSSHWMRGLTSEVITKKQLQQTLEKYL